MALAVGALIATGACAGGPDSTATPPATTAALAPAPLPEIGGPVAAPTTADSGPRQQAAPSTVASTVASTVTTSPGPSGGPDTRTPPAPAAAVPAPVRLATPLPVAMTVLPLVDDSRPTVSGGELVSSSRALTTWVWYPAVASRDPWPLVVFAHGFEVGPAPYAALCEAWAAAGYVVAAPEFPLTDEDVAGDYLDENDIDNQPDDVRFVVGALEAPDSPLPVPVDPDRVAVAGHSDGGVTALGVASDPLPGLRAVIALSASPVYGGSVPNPPILVAQGDNDDINDYGTGEAVYEQAASPRFLLTLLGGGHLPPFLDGSPYLDTVDRVAIAFLDHYVAGRTPTADAVVAAAAADPDLVTLDAEP